MAPLIEYKDVSYAYPGADRLALRELNFSIVPGEIVGVIGPSGAGKSTLCLTLIGIIPQFHRGRFFGEIRLAGKDTVDTPIHGLAPSVGLVLQDPAAQLVTASVEHEVAFAMENAGLPTEEIRARTREALAIVGLSDCGHKHPDELSGGQQQRLALAAAIALKPPVVVLDEPTSQLDPVGTEEVFALVRQLNASHGTTFVIASHATEELAATAHRLLALDGGELVADAPTPDVIRDQRLLRRLDLRPPEVTATFHLLSEAGRWPKSQPLPTTFAEGRQALQQLPSPLALSPPERPIPDRGVPILSLRGVDHVYEDGTRALDGVGLDISRGDYCLLVGHNGAGKSTLLQHLLNLRTPTRGEVMLDGGPMAEFRASDLAGRIGYVPQNPDRQLFNATVEAEVGFALSTTGLTKAERAAKVDDALGQMDLLSFRHAHPFSLSKGDRARVVVAAVLTLDPEVLVFDEPTTGQDAAGARAILDLTKRLHEQGRTIVVVTHHLYLMPDYARRVVVMGGGRVLLDAPLRQAFHAVETLAQTGVSPTQAVALARAAHPANRALTPRELADSFIQAEASP